MKSIALYCAIALAAMLLTACQSSSIYVVPEEGEPGLVATPADGGWEVTLETDKKTATAAVAKALKSVGAKAKKVSDDKNTAVFEGTMKKKALAVKVNQWGKKLTVLTISTAVEDPEPQVRSLIKAVGMKL